MTPSCWRRPDVLILLAGLATLWGQRRLYDPRQPRQISPGKAGEARRYVEECPTPDHARRNLRREELSRVDFERGGETFDDREPRARHAGLDLGNHIGAEVGGLGKLFLGKATSPSVRGDQKTKPPAQIGHAHLAARL
jgi:hypothetical protein